MAECLGKTPEGGAAGNTEPGPGDLNPRTQQSAARARLRVGGLLEGGLDIRSTRNQEAHGPANDSASGRSAAWRQALGGSDGLSFMR